MTLEQFASLTWGLVPPLAVAWMVFDTRRTNKKWREAIAVPVRESAFEQVIFDAVADGRMSTDAGAAVLSLVMTQVRGIK